MTQAFYDELAPYYHLLYSNWEASMARPLSIVVGVLMIGGCSMQRSNVDSARGRDSVRQSITSTRTAAANSPMTWTLTPRGLGPLEAGLTRAAAESLLHRPLAIPGDSDWMNCGYVPRQASLTGVRIMVEEGTVARIDIDSSSTIATTEGERIGDSEASVRQAYGARVDAAPEKYGVGRVLTVTPAAPKDSMHRLIFITDGQRVTQMRAGRLPPVAYVEGCG